MSLFSLVSRAGNWDEDVAFLKLYCVSEGARSSHRCPDLCNEVTVKLVNGVLGECRTDQLGKVRAIT